MGSHGTEKSYDHKSDKNKRCTDFEPNVAKAWARRRQGAKGVPPSCIKKMANSLATLMNKGSTPH
jgi:hypothetical protein